MKCLKFLQYSIKLQKFWATASHIQSQLHDMARIQIRWLCSVILFITGKENICSFYGVSGCKTLKVQ